MKIFIIFIGGGVFITLILVIYLVLEINSVKSDSVLRTEETAKVLKELEDIKNAPALKAARPQEGAGQQPKTAKVSLDDDPVKGDPKAPVTIVEFSDYECPFCKRFYDQALTEIQKEYVDKGKVKLVFRDFPLPFHKKAMPAALAANCAGEQGKYWEMHDFLFENPDKLEREAIMSSAKEMDLDYGKFEACMNDVSKQAEIKKDMEDASKYGVTGTPAFFIGKTENGNEITGVLISGARPFEAFKSQIESTLKESQPQQ